MDACVIRERLAQAAARFARLEGAIFTSFNFNADFFEQNVLPALFGAEEGESRAARVQRVHKALMHTQVGVFCDPSQIRLSLVPYRYSVYPVFLKQRLFHAKNILLFGTDDQDKAWIYLAALSANLTLSGWGRNCEGLADTWIHARTEQPAQALTFFLDWLKDRARVPEGGAIGAAKAFLGRLQGKRHLTDPEDGAFGNKHLVRAYFSPQQASLWSFIRKEYGSLDGVWAASPYWGDCGQIASELAGLPLNLVAARGPSDFDRSNLGEDSLSQLRGQTKLAEPQAWHVEADRFFHIKLYELETACGPVTGIGSCNFTSAGQFWSASAGNVESMLFDAGTHEWACDKLPTGGIRTNSCDDSPAPLPAYVFVQYDWRSESFSWMLEGSLSVELVLPDGGPLLLLDGSTRTGRRAGELRSRMFRFSAGGQSFEGVVTELNLQESSQAYGGRLSPLTILDSWRSGGVVDPPLPRPGPDGESDDEPGTDERSKTPTFDLFGFYQGLATLRICLREVKLRDDLLDRLVARSDSVLAMVGSVLESSLPLAIRWIVMTECIGLLKPYQEQLPVIKAQLRKLRKTAGRLQAELTEQVRLLPHLRGQDIAAQIVGWYATRMKADV